MAKTRTFYVITSVSKGDEYVIIPSQAGSRVQVEKEFREKGYRVLYAFPVRSLRQFKMMSKKQFFTGYRELWSDDLYDMIQNLKEDHK